LQVIQLRVVELLDYPLVRARVKIVNSRRKKLNDQNDEELPD
jgi:hypothetical protein